MFLFIVLKRNAEEWVGLTLNLESLGLGFCTTSGGLVSESHSFLQWESDAQFLTDVQLKTQESNQVLDTHTKRSGKKEIDFFGVS